MKQIIKDKQLFIRRIFLMCYDMLAVFAASMLALLLRFDFHMENIPDEYINEYSAVNIVQSFADWRIENTQSRFRYSRSGQPVAETALTYRDGTPREFIKPGSIGAMSAPGEHLLINFCMTA